MTVHFEPVTTIELASSGVSLRFELNGELHYISVTRLKEVISGKRPYTEVSVKVEEEDPEPRDPDSLLTQQIANSIRHAVLTMNVETRQK